MVAIGWTLSDRASVAFRMHVLYAKDALDGGAACLWDVHEFELLAPIRWMRRLEKLLAVWEPSTHNVTLQMQLRVRSA
eukprot:2091733-Amphidinium_carterae.1